MDNLICGKKFYFYISSRISRFELTRDEEKTPDQLVDEMEEHFYLQEVAWTSIFIRKKDPHNIVEFRTYDDLFDTINRALPRMLLKAKRNEEVEEVLGKEPDVYNHGYGWDFPPSLLPYMKQLIYKAIEAHDFRAPQDRTIPRRYGERIIVRIK